MPTSITAFVGRAPKGPVHTPVTLTSFAEFEATFGGLTARSRMGHSVEDFFRHGGRTAVVVRVARTAIIGEGFRHRRHGLYALDDVDLINLLVIPAYDVDGGIEDAVRDAALEYAQERGAMFVMDAPPRWSDLDIARTEAQVLPRSSFGAMYFPRLMRPDPIAGGTIRPLGPSGAVAGLIARTDHDHGVWKAPAGVDATLVDVAQLEVALEEHDRAALNGQGVSCLRQIAPDTCVVWGARTLAGQDGLDPEWKYVNVRRYFAYLEESIDRGTQWVVFEPNEESTWTQVRRSAEEFLHAQWQAGALTGAKPEEAYFVRCDRTTMTEADIDDGRLVIEIGFAPLRPAEFVIIRIGQWRDDDGD